jgi:hypothetical protein
MASEEVIIYDIFYDVPSDNYEEFDQQLDETKFGDKLVQKNVLKGTVREFQFYADDYLLVNCATNKNTAAKKFRVNLAWLSAEPEHHKIIVWKWLYAAFCSGIVAALCIFFTFNENIDITYGAVAATISVSATLIFALIFIYHMRDEYIFKSCFGATKLFLVENKQPEQSSFDQFFINLQQAIDKSQRKLSITERLVGELKMCRRLRDEGIIDDAAYTASRSIIFKHEQYKA